jgi:glutathione-regulated potassium-efflux system ancillary protein KefF
MSDILLLLAHPDLQHSRVHAALRAALQPESTHAGARWELRDLYALYPDYLIDVAAEQEALLRARLVVWLHPVHWYGMPPLLKLWVDEVFTYGWAYGPGGDRLAGKDLWLVVSTGGTEASYRPAATTAFSSTRSGRRMSRRRRWPACVFCHRWCCTVRTMPHARRSTSTSRC